MASAPLLTTFAMAEEIAELSQLFRASYLATSAWDTFEWLAKSRL